MSELKVQLHSLFADSAVQFTDRALEMRFTAKTLVADIKRFQTYVLNSSLGSNVDQNEFLYQKLRQKITAVRPDILMHAASEFQLHLDHTGSFDAYVQQAIAIAHRVQVASPPKRASSPPKNPPPGKQAKVASAGDKGLSKFQRMAKLPDDEVLTNWHRCHKCGWRMDGEVHANGHTCDPDKRAERLAGIRRSLAADTNPNKRKVSFTGKQGSK